MIEVKMTSELLQDLFTPGHVPQNRCVSGLPENSVLKDVTFKNGIITFEFDHESTKNVDVPCSVNLEFKCISEQ